MDKSLLALLLLCACTSKLSDEKYAADDTKKNIVVYKQHYSFSMPRDIDVTFNGVSCELPDDGFLLIPANTKQIKFSAWDIGESVVNLNDSDKFVRVSYQQAGATEYGAGTFGILGAAAGTAIDSNSNREFSAFGISVISKENAENEIRNHRKAETCH